MLVVISICCGGPTQPSGSVSVVVRVVDELSELPILDPAFGITVTLTGPSTATQAAIGATAVFSGLAPGAYAVTTDYVYGYRQREAMSVMLDGRHSVTLPLLPVDDLGVTEVVVDGQGSIPKGGTIRRQPWPLSYRLAADCCRYPQ